MFDRASFDMFLAVFFAETFSLFVGAVILSRVSWAGATRDAGDLHPGQDHIYLAIHAVVLSCESPEMPRKG